MVVWRRLAEVPADDRVLPWLYGVARHVLANEFRQARRARQLTEHVASQPRVDTSPDHADAVADRQGVAAAFDGLPDADRELLRLIA